MPVPNFLGPLVPVVLSPPLGGGAPSNVLAFSIQAQQCSEWCWAATASSFAAFYANAAGMTQCQIAGSCLGISCCSTPVPMPCNQPGALDQALQVVEHLAAPPAPTPYSMASLQSEIDGGRPVCCHIKWSDETGHFNAIYGYDAGVGDVDVGDPYYGNQTTPYTTLQTDYQSAGVWDYYYLTH